MGDDGHAFNPLSCSLGRRCLDDELCGIFVEYLSIRRFGSYVAELDDFSVSVFIIAG